MSNLPTQNLATFSFPGQFPITAPDIQVSGSAQNPSAGGIVDMDTLQNLQQDLTNRLTELPGSNLDFNYTTTYATNTSLNFLEDVSANVSNVVVTTTAASSPNNRGVGIMTYLSGTVAKLQGLPHRIDQEFEQDPRVVQSSTSLIQQADGSYLITTQLQVVGGVFGLAWSWSQAGIASIPIQA